MHLPPLGSQSGIDLILKWADFEVLYSRGGHMARGPGIPLTPETCSGIWSDQPVPWDSDHPGVPEQLPENEVCLVSPARASRKAYGQGVYGVSLQMQIKCGL